MAHRVSQEYLATRVLTVHLVSRALMEHQDFQEHRVSPVHLASREHQVHWVCRASLVHQV